MITKFDRAKYQLHCNGKNIYIVLEKDQERFIDWDRVTLRELFNSDKISDKVKFNSSEEAYKYIDEQIAKDKKMAGD